MLNFWSVICATVRETHFELDLLLLSFDLTLFLDQMFQTSVQMYNDDPEAIYAVIAMVLSSFFLQANVYVTLRMLKGMQFTN